MKVDCVRQGRKEEREREAKKEIVRKRIRMTKTREGRMIRMRSGGEGGE